MGVSCASADTASRLNVNDGKIEQLFSNRVVDTKRQIC